LTFGIFCGKSAVLPQGRLRRKEGCRAAKGTSMSGNGTSVESPTEAVPAERAQGDEAKTDKALGDSVRAFLRANGLKHTPKKEREDLRLWQVVFLIAFAIDITFLYLMIPEGKGWAFFEKLLPALGGTLAVSYFERLRSWLFKHSKNSWLGGLFLVIALGGLVMQWPIYSIFVQIDPSSSDVEVKLDEKKVEKLEKDRVECREVSQTGCFFLPGRKPQSYQVVLREQESETPYQISTSDVLEGTLARLPFVGRVVKPRPLWLTYELTTVYKNPEGVLYISAGPGLPLNRWDPQLRPAIKPPTAACPSSNCWQTQTQLQSGEVFALPRGSYTFTQENGGFCLQTLPIPVPGQSTLNVYPGGKGMKEWKCK
jgi:hypothetical protein